jgi:hypothetical protein
LGKRTAQDDHVLVSLFDPYDFKQCPVDLNIVKEKLALDASPRGGRQNRRETYVNQSQQP